MVEALNYRLSQLGLKQALVIIAPRFRSEQNRGFETSGSCGQLTEVRYDSTLPVGTFDFPVGELACPRGTELRRLRETSDSEHRRGLAAERAQQERH